MADTCETCRYFRKMIRGSSKGICECSKISLPKLIERSVSDEACKFYVRKRGVKSGD